MCRPLPPPPPRRPLPPLPLPCCRCSPVFSLPYHLHLWALGHTVVARYNMMAHAWRRVITRAGISSSLEPHVEQLPQRLRAAGLPVLPSRPMAHPRVTARPHVNVNVNVHKLLVQPLPQLLSWPEEERACSTPGATAAPV